MSTDEVFDLINSEHERQKNTLELIASENHVSDSVMRAVGSCLTNKYAEGYPGKRYYGGCHYYDEIENLAIDRAKKLFNCNFANVQPHSGANANTAAFMAFMNPDDTYASLVLSDGGHLSHGLKINISGKYFNPVHYPLIYDESNTNFEHIDYEKMLEICLEHKPKMLLCGYSAYPRIIDFQKFREVADACGAILMADIAHISGLVASGVHPSPFPHAHVVTTTTHKTLRGPRGGLILCDDEEISKKVNRAVFPGTQGGPLMHVIAGKAVAFAEALTSEFIQYSKQIVLNSQALSSKLSSLGHRLVSGGTDNHLMLLDLRPVNPDLYGSDAEKMLESAGIITNKNGIPNDPRPPVKTSGLRLGTPAVTTRGMSESEMKEIAIIIDEVIRSNDSQSVISSASAKVENLCQRFPLA